MSKDKKAAYAEKQRTAGVSADAKSLTPLVSSGPPVSSKKPKVKKASRGK